MVDVENQLHPEWPIPLPGVTSALLVSMDDRYVYIASGKIPWYLVAVHGVAAAGCAAPGVAARIVADQLVAEKVEIHPVFITAALGAVQQFAIEVAGLGDVADLDGEVEGGQFTHDYLQSLV